MNIAMFASAFHPSLGGVEELCRQLAHTHRSAGHNVIIVTERWPRNLPAHEEFEGIPVYRFPMRVPTGHLKANFTFRLTHSTICKQLNRVIRENQIDVLHVQCVSSNSFYATRVKKSLGLPLVVTLQGELTMDAAGMFMQPGIGQDIMRSALAQADMITACSRKTLEDAEKFYGSSLANGSRVIFNAANTADFASSKPYVHPRPYFLALGRLVPQKGFDILIDAYAKLEGDTPDLLIAGDGAEKQNLLDRIKFTGMTGRVHLIGRADRPMVASLMAGAMFLAIPSRADEGLPVVCAEAMSAGCPIIATRSGGVPEAIIDGETGLIVEKEDAAGLLAAMKRLIADPELRKSFSQAGKQRSKLFSWEVVAAEYLTAYQSAAQVGVSQQSDAAVPVAATV